VSLNISCVRLSPKDALNSSIFSACGNAKYVEDLLVAAGMHSRLTMAIPWLSGILTFGLNGLRQGDAHPPMLQMSMALLP